MSLTSYRAAPSRANVWRTYFGRCIVREIPLLCCKEALFIRFGSDLLSHVLRRSTISAAALNCRVRDGIGCFARAMTTNQKNNASGAPFEGHTVMFQVMYDCSFVYVS